MKAISADTMRELDAGTIDAGTPGEVLMERAGEGSWALIRDYCAGLAPQHAQRFLVLVGKGNNGGDGYVIARLVAEEGHDVTVLSVCAKDELTGDALLNAQRLPTTVVYVLEPELIAAHLTSGTIIVDCLLGTGIKGSVRDPYKAIILAVNASCLPVIAIDIPSGVNADSGVITDVAIEADLTITMALPKTGLLLGRGPEHTGRLRRVDIGILRNLEREAESSFEAILSDDIQPLIRRVPNAAHKGDMGRIAIVGGSTRYPGALALAGMGCLRSGGGLVTLAYPESARAQLGHHPNALIQFPIPDADKGFLNAAATETLMEFIEGQDVVALGPGLGRNPESLALIAELLKSDKPVVLDADGLKVFTHHPEAMPREAPTIITPHPGEMKRILRALDAEHLLEEDRISQARGVAKRLQAVTVLKGAFTVIADKTGEIAVNTSGSQALATGGSGDILTGMCAAWLHQLRDPFAAAKTAVFIHGLAGELSPYGTRHLIADDLPEMIGMALEEISPLA